MKATHTRIRSLLPAVFAAACIHATAAAQSAPTTPASPAATPEPPVVLEKFIVTGSMIKRVADEGALPVITFTTQDIDMQGISSAEQLVAHLNINGNGLDNLASNADVVAGAQRGNNGATSANLRGQGSNATLILLNGRRVPYHGLNGGVVDLHQIPFAAIERVEILKDGASAIYGTDAIGGVINFILKRDFTGIHARASTDVTDDGGGNIHRYSLVAGHGDLQEDGFNVTATVSLSDHEMLRGDERDFVDTFQPERGLSPDTRGAPVATIFAISSLYSALSRDNLNATGRGTGPLDPASPPIPGLRVNGINIVDLPTGPGYAGLDGMGPYDEVLWAAPASKYGSAWDTGRAAVLQQPVKNKNLVARGSYKLGDHILSAEAVIGRSESAKSFSPNQITSSTAANTTTANGTTVPNPFFNLAYPSTGADYNRVFNALVAFFPALEPNRGLPMAFRWRALPGGNREIFTRSDTRRFLVSSEGPMPFLDRWEYRAAMSFAESESHSELLSGYFFTVPFANLITTGVLNPFSYTQTPAALTALEQASAKGVRLYGGTFSTEQADFVASGPVWKLPHGTLMAAVGLDARIEKYEFKGDPRPNVSTADSLIFNAPFDNLLATGGELKRDITAAFAEVLVPVWKGLEVTGAARIDEYTGFGRTTNPKVTLRYAPADKLLFRSSYSTGFRVPTFKQMFDPLVQTTYVGNDFADPASGSIIVGPGNPAVNPLLFSGGKSDLQPEEAEMYSAGVVYAPSNRLSFNVDWWSVERDGSIQLLGLTTLANNYALFQDRFIRNSSGALVAVDVRWINTGETVTKGVDFGATGNADVWGGKLSGGIDISYLTEKKSRLIPTAAFGASEIGRFTRAGDLGLKWKYTAHVTYRKGNWTARLTEVYRAGYMDAVLPGVANGTVVPPQWNPKVDEYDIYHLNLSYRLSRSLNVIAGVKNIFNDDPPFSAAYDTNTGAGSSWEPRVADPRGRSFTLQVEYTFN